jgi:NTE family protein
MKQKIALVLSGGGARGTAHIGVIEELVAQGFEISSIAGTSMGSLVGGMYALGKIEEFKDWMYSLDRIKVFSLVDFSFGHLGLIKAERVLKAMKQFTGDANIEDLKVPYAAVAADIINNKEVVFRSGSLYSAIRASIAIPAVITPVKTETGILVDGGVMNNIPVNHVNRTEGDKLVVVNVNANIPVIHPVKSEKKKQEDLNIYQQKIKEFYAHLSKINPLHKEEKLSYIDLVSKSIYLMINHIAQMHLDHYEPDMLIEVSKEACNTFDFYKAKELIEMGRLATQNAIIQNR